MRPDKWFYILLLPLHWPRLAAIRMTIERTDYELAQRLNQELRALDAAIVAAQKMERKVAEMDLVFKTSRQAVLEVMLGATARIREHVKACFPVETAMLEQERGQVGREKTSEDSEDDINGAGLPCPKKGPCPEGARSAGGAVAKELDAHGRDSPARHL